MRLSLKELSKKHIPTILGLFLLLSGLVVGVFLVRSTNTNSFLPRASPETTPKNIKITNISDSTFSVSWVTDGATVGFVRYGTSTSSQTLTATDDRDQSSGATGLFRTHHITVRSLQPTTTYYFKLGTGTQELYDNNGAPYSVTTVSSVSSQARTMYGEIQSTGGAPAAGSLVYITSDNIAPLSTVVQSSGSWVVSLAQARTKDLSSSATLQSDTPISILVISPTDGSGTTATTTLAQSQPVPQITLGSSQDFTQSATPIPISSTQTTPAPTPISEQVQSKFTSLILPAPTEVTNGLAISNPASDGETITTSKPQFFGTATAGTKVALSLKSKTTQTITVTTNTSGQWQWTPSSKLANAPYVLTASQDVSKVNRAFRVDTTQAGVIPALTATGSASLATPIPVTDATAATPAATTIARVSNPATSAGTIVSGTVTPTILLILGGFISLFIGTGLWLFLPLASDKRS